MMETEAFKRALLEGREIAHRVMDRMRDGDLLGVVWFYLVTKIAPEFEDAVQVDHRGIVNRMRDDFVKRAGELGWYAPEQLKRLKAEIEALGYLTKVDTPKDEHGSWWLDIMVADRTDVLDEITFSIGGGFGFFSDDAGFGSKPDDLVATVKQALDIITPRLAARKAQ